MMARLLWQCSSLRRHPFGGNALFFSVDRGVFHPLPPYHYIPNNLPQLSHTLSSGSPGDGLRGIQRRASGHKSAARRFLPKLRPDYRLPLNVNAAQLLRNYSSPHPCSPIFNTNNRGVMVGCILDEGGIDEGAEGPRGSII